MSISENSGKGISISKQAISTWSAIALAAATAFTAYTETKGTKDFATSFESGHYDAIMDVRRKVDFLFKRVVEIDSTVASLSSQRNEFDPVIRPPGPSTAPPPQMGYWGNRYIAGNCARCPECCVQISKAPADPEKKKPDVVTGFLDILQQIEQEKPVEVKPTEKKPVEKKPVEEKKDETAPDTDQQVPFQTDKDGNPVWKPIKRK